MKILVISHAHPDFSVGGAEIAAFNFFRSVDTAYPQHDVTFLARTDVKTMSPGAIMAYRPSEYLWRQDIADWFFLKGSSLEVFSANFRAFLTAQKPDVVYVHHFVHIGVEMFRIIRQTCPAAKIILTIHEYVSICHRQGQMIKMDSNKLCYRSGPIDCHNCFPNITPERFWLREDYLKKNLEIVDTFIAPSHFLKERYVAWGLPPDRVVVIENGQPTLRAPAAPTEISTGPQIIGYFGQVTPYKGLDVFLRALNLLRGDLKGRLKAEIHGANIEKQEEKVRNTIEELTRPLIADGTLRWVGSYERNEALSRISGVDWVVVPSIWWENSPMVIQEAFVCRKPVIASNIGGMAEKVRHGVDGLHFEVGNPFALAERLSSIVQDPGMRSRLVANIRPPLSYADAAVAYLSVLA